MAGGKEMVTPKKRERGKGGLTSGLATQGGRSEEPGEAMARRRIRGGICRGGRRRGGRPARVLLAVLLRGRRDVAPWLLWFSGEGGELRPRGRVAGELCGIDVRSSEQHGDETARPQQRPWFGRRRLTRDEEQ
jgi:hypothetical protein